MPQPRRGDIYWCELDKPRPVVILTRDALIAHLHSVTVAPLTTRVRGIASQVMLETFDGVPERSAISLDNIQTVYKEDLGEFITSLSTFRLKELERAALFALELDKFGE
ncbi:type II toxin-antitoxin system PemK/MazF family toxin [Deinococcus sp. VB343]|uniref:Type II toxin-antitoxin system PemK/MazF family toxin n=1 Tax=Deinococcus sp. VB142 TaxID=3112952 RepID=A0AAU6PZ20_9DEIO|nr:type II toxin-antitoxin system PemK/MazF family toxin [Deinococcus sp.]MDO4245761.1 type II toxin-antitoxin system PemK/MazF family toxin [Deinococcus sp.]